MEFQQIATTEITDILAALREAPERQVLSIRLPQTDRQKQRHITEYRRYRADELADLIERLANASKTKETTINS